MHGYLGKLRLSLAAGAGYGAKTLDYEHGRGDQFRNGETGEGHSETSALFTPLTSEPCII